MYLVVENERQTQLKWVNAILDARKWRANRLATEARIDPSSLSRFLNDRTGKRTLNSYSVEKIEAASGFIAYETEPSSKSSLSFNRSSGDLSAYETSGSIDVDRAVSAIVHGRNSVEPWLLQSRCLEGAGYLPGDVLLFDMNARPARGDVVAAQIFGRSGRPELIVRRYAEPFLYSVTTDADLMEPILIDKNVSLLGVLLTSMRARSAA